MHTSDICMLIPANLVFLLKKDTFATRFPGLLGR
jgi:hypothetical protein